MLQTQLQFQSNQWDCFAHDMTDKLKLCLPVIQEDQKIHAELPLQQLGPFGNMGCFYFVHQLKNGTEQKSHSEML